jgi:RHS repeat-associated protein
MHERIVVGQLLQTTDYEALEFDAVNRVTAVVKGTRRSEFFYDGVGRRVRMVEREGATTVSDRRYIWDGGEIVEERDGANASVVTKRYFGAGVQEVAAQATTNLFYSRDHLGSVREVTDANGNLVARYDYDAWGRQTQVFGTYRADWGYAGYFVHRASKLNLTWYRAYDPDLGRWVSRDPIAEQGGLNLYGYVDNNSISFIDNYGLQKRKQPEMCSAQGKNCTDSSGRVCKCEEIKTIRLLNYTPKAPAIPHTFLELPGRTVGFYPRNRGKGWSPGSLVDDRFHSYNKSGKTFTVCPETLKMLNKSIDSHANDFYDVTRTSGQNCTSWACNRLVDSGINWGKSYSGFGVLNPWSLQNIINDFP